MTLTLTTSYAIILKAGANASATATTSNAILEQFGNKAEDLFCANARYDLITNYANLITNGKKIIDDGVSSAAAMFVISYDMSGFTSRVESQTMLDLLDDNLKRALELTKGDNIKTFLSIT